MDLDSIRLFVRVAELGSFTRASEHLGLSKARASIRIRELEAELGCRLLLRSTRAVRLTEDGEQFLPRAKRLTAEADELVAMFQAPSTLRGRVRVDLPIRLALDHVIPRLPEFLAAHPQIELLVSTTDQHVDLVRDGFDCVVRVGKLPDSGLVARRLGTLPMVNCASPTYLRKFGIPRTLADLDRHWLVDYSASLGAAPPTFEYRDGDRYRERPMQSMVTVNGTDAYQAACIAGLGIIQAPRIGTRASLARGELVEILPELECARMPVSVLQAHSRVREPVRALTTWLAAVLAPHLS
ncbi:MAG TPA: LysR family transcriptional regulator [Polyangiaceae bacterium]|nr:LysR family transcriptional regulator [Polyangiaceae bacterium]